MPAIGDNKAPQAISLSMKPGSKFLKSLQRRGKDSSLPPDNPSASNVMKEQIIKVTIDSASIHPPDLVTSTSFPEETGNNRLDFGLYLRKTYNQRS